MNRILRFTLFTLVWMCSSAASATVIKKFDLRADYPKFSVMYPQQRLGGLNLDWLDSHQPPLKKSYLAQLKNRWQAVRPPVPTPGGVKPPAAVAEPAVLELMVLGFSVLVLLRIRQSRINDAAQNPAS
jgi:hypothetical protein